jgi:nucleotide-binding universal stress UspA family protein
VKPEKTTIMVAVDRPEPVLVAAARDLAQTYGAPLVLCHVAEHQVSDGRRLPFHVDEKTVERTLEDLAATLRADGLDARVELHAAPLGRAAHVLADSAQTNAAGLLVVGVSRHGRVSRFLHGSTLRRLEERADCPMLLVPLPTADADQELPPNHSGGKRERAPRREPRRGFAAGERPVEVRYPA